jgi:hypothetical protein
MIYRIILWVLPKAGATRVVYHEEPEICASNANKAYLKPGTPGVG